MSNKRSKKESREYKGSGTGCMFQAIGTVLLGIGGGIEFFAINNNLNMEAYADAIHTGAFAFALPGLISFVGGFIQNRSEKPDIERAAKKRGRRNSDLGNFKVDKNTPKASNTPPTRLSRREQNAINRANKQQNQRGGYTMTSLGEEKIQPMSRSQRKAEEQAEREVRKGKTENSTRGVTIVNLDNWENLVTDKSDLRNKKFMEQVDHALNSPNLAGKIRKIEGESDEVIVVKHGKVRMFGLKNGEEVEITNIERRREGTYKRKK